MDRALQGSAAAPSVSCISLPPTRSQTAVEITYHIDELLREILMVASPDFSGDLRSCTVTCTLHQTAYGVRMQTKRDRRNLGVYSWMKCYGRAQEKQRVLLIVSNNMP